MFKKILTNSKGGRRLVISDVHGCLNTFKALIEKKINLTRNDQLFLLGDYINRGKNSSGVIDYIIQLKEQGYLVFPLRGNHEEMLQDAWLYNQHVKGTSDEIPLSARMMGAYDLLDAKGELQAKYAHFLQQLPYYYELDTFYLVHAGFNFKAQNPFTDYTSMVWIRNFQDNPTSKTIVHGHQVKDLNEIENKVEKKNAIIALDNGCYYGLSNSKEDINAQLRKKVGNLCGLDLDTLELIVQENID